MASIAPTSAQAGPVRLQLATDKMIGEKENGIGWITFNNPARRNAISHEMRHGLIAILGAFENDDEVRVVVLKGSGDKAFVAGSDISEFKEKRANPELAAEYQAVSKRVHAAYEELTKPLIAMIHGACLGGGINTALKADLRIASDDAVFGIPAARLGLAYAYTGLKKVVDTVGPSRAMEMLFTARRFNAQEALQMGLVNEVVPRAHLEARVRELAAMIVDNAPMSVRAAKLMTREAVKDSDKRNLDICAALVKECFASEDYQEGRTAFMEKRKPVFKGR